MPAASTPALFRPAGAVAARPPILDQARSLLQKFFSPEAKILGVVRFVDLLQILGFGDIASLADATPVLKETLQFGAGLSEADADLAQVVHVQLLAPLLNTVQSFQAQWNGTPAKIGGLKKLPLQKAFPEIDAGLTDLAGKLAKALNDNDTLGIALDLAEVYESAQAFAAALERIAANPAARLKQTAVDAINDVLGELAAPFSVFAGSITALVSLLKGAQGGAEAWVNQQLSQQPILDQAIDIFALSLPSPRLPDLAQQTGESVAGMHSIADAFESALRKAVVDAAVAAVGQASTDLDPVKIRAAFIRTLATGEQDAASDAIKAVSKAPAPIPAAAIVWRNELNALVTSLAQVDPNADPNVDPPPVVSSVFKAAGIAKRLFEDVKRLTSSGEPADLAPYAADLAGYLFGFDTAAFVDGGQSLMQILSEAVNKAGGLDLDALAATTFAHPVPTAFADAVIVCDAYAQLSDDAKRGDYPHRTVPPGQPQPPSLDNGPTLALEGALTTLEAALAALKAAGDTVVAWQAALDASSGTERTRILAFAGANQALDAIDRSELLLRGVGRAGGSGLGLIGDVATLYCDAVVDTALITAAANALSKSVLMPALTGALVDQTGAYGRAAAEMAKKLGEDLFAVLQRVDSFGALHMPDALGFITTNHLIDSTLQTTFDALSAALLGFEVPLVAALTRVVNVALELSNHAKAFGSKLVASAQSTVDKFDAALQRLGLVFDQLPKAKNAIQALQNLTAVPDFKSISVTPPPTTFQALAATDIGGGGLKVADLFNSSTRYNAPVIAARNAEIEVTAALGQIAARVRGLPKDSARQLVVIAAPLFQPLSDAYKNDQGDGLLKTRNLISKQVVESLGLQDIARRDLYVAVSDAYSLPGFPAVDVTKPDVSFDALNAGDRLAQEALVASQAKSFGALADADQAFANLTRFAQSWSGNPQNRAAPLQIGDKVTELAREALKGEILSLIDISAFRTAVLDAVANLVPTKATFAYDFASTVNDAASAGSIFLPEQDAEFALSTRIDVDLLHESHVDLTTQGSLGPFAIALVGQIVDALTLRFGGAKFESHGGGAPRFDISYQSYEIGPALDFAKQLQAYLTPSDGAGFHIGTSTLGVGIEAGYGVNLGTIAIGPVSFFNIIFDVSADLPFDNRQALFKTSLGTRTTPFTISALPYAGSGYFSIYASADGIRGFEAGFMFGGGGALAFGPLTAQVQVQVGAFMRILKIDKYNVTEVAGTFLAAGSASIWIFHFGASLYVALEQSAGGNMRGEAIFTFSFSCGFVDYHYSITAHHNQAAVGKNNDPDTGWLDRGEPLTRYALASAAGSDERRLR